MKLGVDLLKGPTAFPCRAPSTEAPSSGGGDDVDGEGLEEDTEQSRQVARLQFCLVCKVRLGVIWAGCQACPPI